MDLLVSIESTAIAIWVRESISLWAYPGILSLHTIGLGFLVGVSATIDLRVLGAARGIPLEALRRFVPVFWLGFWLNALSGALLLAAYASTTLVNPIFVAKLVIILLAVINVWYLNRRLFGDRLPPPGGSPPRSVKALAVSSLLLWVGAVTTGRMTAYHDLIQGLLFGEP
ncbi:MAG TPA: DUF6644 family protein [Thermoanaerobaculia bacterium]|nr:DUF6644 family protein [Thermoanaerobaculia bacterium]